MLLLTLIIAALTKTINAVIHDVIIVGAGAAGISAAKVLNQKHIDHAIVESRDRIGGRIQSA
jgi:monoamine oxidase